MVFGLKLGIIVCLNQGYRCNGDRVMYYTTRSRPNRPRALPRTITLLDSCLASGNKSRMTSARDLSGSSIVSY